MQLVRDVGERYLWVDALCIVQDNDESKMRDIHNMGVIYANATFTIVAADGDASDGLTAHRDVRLSRSFIPFYEYTVSPTKFTRRSELKDGPE
jgi:hypothetical protein